MQTLPSPFHKKTRRAALFFWLAWLILQLTGCASVPEREFSDYLDLFEQVRKSSEVVLIDYAVAKKEALALEQERDSIPYNRQSSFQTNRLVVPEDSIDDVAIRFKAWEIIDAYNQSLVNLIAGNPGKTEDKTKSLLRTIIGFSSNALIGAAGDILPAFSALKGIAKQVEMVYEKQKIIAIMTQVSPLISQQFIATMRQDSTLFYQVRYGLNSYHYQQTTTQIGRKVAEFIKLAHSVSQASRNKTVIPLMNAMNDKLVTVVRNANGDKFKVIALKAEFGNNDAPQTLAQLSNLKDQVLTLIEQAEQQNKNLDAYRQMLTSYVRMLNELDFQLKIMLYAAQNQQTVEILGDNDFNKTVLRMRQAYLFYENSKL